jgi:pimeloyl-ACP methyl ester carboxylesterase
MMIVDFSVKIIFCNLQFKICNIKSQIKCYTQKIEGAGRPLLILHGFLGMSDNWKTLGMQFATEGLKFIC